MTFKTNVIKARCRICKQIYYKRAKKLRGHRGTSVRGVNSVTCSPRCSKLNIDLKNGQIVIVNGRKVI